MKILLLEDDNILNRSITQLLKAYNYEVDSFYDGEDALNNFGGYDLYILDINTPNINGIDLLKYITSISSSIKIIMMSSDLNIQTIKTAYANGCYDYIKKPFHIEELLLKINNIAQHNNQIITLSDTLKYDLKNKSLLNNDIAIKLTKKEIYFIHLLILNIGDIITFNQIDLEVYNNSLPKQTAIRAMVKRLRDKLPKNTIVTITDIGYKIQKK